MAPRVVANVAGIACVALVLASTARQASGWRNATSGAAFIAGPTVQEPVPCAPWWRRTGRDDTATAIALTNFAARMKALADSAISVLSDRTPNWEDATPELFRSAAEVAQRGAAFAPDHPPSLLIASQVALRTATLGEARIDTVWGKAAECYAKRAVDFAVRNGDRATAAEARTVLEDVQVSLREERRAADVERRRRP